MKLVPNQFGSRGITCCMSCEYITNVFKYIDDNWYLELLSRLAIRASHRVMTRLILILRFHDITTRVTVFCFLFHYFTWFTFICLIECDTDQETDRLLGAQRSDDRGFFDEKVSLFHFYNFNTKNFSQTQTQVLFII
jgi:hypothetical protein